MLSRIRAALRIRTRLRRLVFDAGLLAVRPVDDLVLITGADRTHFRSLIQFLESARRNEPDIPIIAHDLGLEPEQRHELDGRFPGVEVRIFPYADYPAYFDIRVAAGEYAWKPVIVSEVIREKRCCVCWMDAGNVICEPLIQLRKVLRRDGFYSMVSPGTVSTWTHPGTLQYLQVPARILVKRNLGSGCVGANYQFPRVVRLIERWRGCALNKECIAPVGSSRQNHRQDQAVLSVLVHLEGMSRLVRPWMLGFIVQQDVDGRR